VRRGFAEQGNKENSGKKKPAEMEMVCFGKEERESSRKEVFVLFL